MKKSLFLVTTLVAIFGVSCQTVSVDVAPADEGANSKLTTFTCEFPSMVDKNGTKVTLGADGKTAWEADVDAIVFQGCPKDVSPVVHTFTSSELDNPQVASFSVDLSGLVDDEGMSHKINVAYPAGIWSPYSSSHMYGRSSFSNTNKMLMAGYVDGSSIELFHLTAAIAFQVAGSAGDYDSYVFKGNNGEVVGYSKLLVEINKPSVTSYRKKYAEEYAPYGSAGPQTSVTGPVISNGTAVNTVFLPVNTKDNVAGTESEDEANMILLPNGFTIQLLQGGVIKKYIKATTSLTIRPGHMINLGVLPPEKIYDYDPGHSSSIPIESAKSDLGAANGTANCYFINPVDAITNEKGSIFKFEAVKGNSSETVDNIASVSVLWRTFNNTTTPGDTDVVKAVDYDNTGAKTYIVFQLPDSHQPGNAVIAAKNAGGEILWSWHIWVPSTTVTDVTSTAFHDGEAQVIAMDRNLGALEVATTAAGASVYSYGLYYQWGRKDPFPAAKRVDSGSQASVVGIATTVSEALLSDAEAIKQPTVIGFEASKSDWLNPSDKTRWADGTKSVNDPCPAGYRVPARNKSLPFMASNLENVTGFVYSAENHYFAIGTPEVVFPLAGFRKYTKTTVELSQTGSGTVLWTSYSSTEGQAYCVQYDSDEDREGKKARLTEWKNGTTASVRCVAE